MSESGMTDHDAEEHQDCLEWPGSVGADEGGQLLVWDTDPDETVDIE